MAYTRSRIGIESPRSARLSYPGRVHRSPAKVLQSLHNQPSSGRTRRRTRRSLRRQGAPGEAAPSVHPDGRDQKDSLRRIRPLFDCRPVLCSLSAGSWALVVYEPADGGDELGLRVRSGGCAGCDPFDVPESDNQL